MIIQRTMPSDASDKEKITYILGLLSNSGISISVTPEPSLNEDKILIRIPTGNQTGPDDTTLELMKNVANNLKITNMRIDNLEKWMKENLNE